MKPGPKFTEKHPKLAKFLSEKAPHIFNAVKDAIPDRGVLGLIKNLLPTDQRVSEEDKALLVKELTDTMLEFYKQDSEDYKTEVDDRKDSRSREIEFLKATGGKRDWIQGTLAIFGVAAPVGIVIYLIACGLPVMSPEISMLIGGLIGMIVGEYKTIFSYFFGSSRGSKEKTQMFDKVMSKM